jgi:hypothetical protein
MFYLITINRYYYEAGNAWTNESGTANEAGSAYDSIHGNFAAFNTGTLGANRAGIK